MSEKIDPVVTTMAKLLGSKGGTANTSAQMKARKRNIAAAQKTRWLQYHRRKSAKAA